MAKGVFAIALGLALPSTGSASAATQQTYYCATFSGRDGTPATNHYAIVASNQSGNELHAEFKSAVMRANPGRSGFYGACDALLGPDAAKKYRADVAREIAKGKERWVEFPFRPTR